jgi:hypothetical protein
MGKSKDIREAVEAVLVFDPLVDSADNTVKNMKNVHNHLEVVLPLAAIATTPC